MLMRIIVTPTCTKTIGAISNTWDAITPLFILSRTLWLRSILFNDLIEIWILKKLCIKYDSRDFHGQCFFQQRLAHKFLLYLCLIHKYPYFCQKFCLFNIWDKSEFYGKIMTTTIDDFYGAWDAWTNFQDHGQQKNRRQNCRLLWKPQ